MGCYVGSYAIAQHLPFDSLGHNFMLFFFFKKRETKKTALHTVIYIKIDSLSFLFPAYYSCDTWSAYSFLGYYPPPNHIYKFVFLFCRRLHRSVIRVNSLSVLSLTHVPSLHFMNSQEFFLHIFKTLLDKGFRQNCGFSKVRAQQSVFLSEKHVCDLYL